MGVGTLFGAFSYYEMQDLSSVILGRVCKKKWILGTVFSSWEETSGTVSLAFNGAARESWMKRVLALHRVREGENDPDSRLIQEDPWEIRFASDVGFDSFFEAFSPLKLEPKNRKCGFFLGDAKSSSRRYVLTGQSRGGCVAILLESVEEVEGTSPHERILLLGDLFYNAKNMRGRFVRVLRHHDFQQMGTFQGNPL